MRANQNFEAGKSSAEQVQEQVFHYFSDYCLAERQVSMITGIPLTTLRRDRSMGRGIPFVKYGKSVRYLWSDVASYIEQHRETTIDDPRRHAA